MIISLSIQLQMPNLMLSWQLPRRGKSEPFPAECRSASLPFLFATSARGTWLQKKKTDQIRRMRNAAIILDKVFISARLSIIHLKPIKPSSSSRAAKHVSSSFVSKTPYEKYNCETKTGRGVVRLRKTYRTSPAPASQPARNQEQTSTAQQPAPNQPKARKWGRGRQMHLSGCLKLLSGGPVGWGDSREI